MIIGNWDRELMLSLNSLVGSDGLYPLLVLVNDPLFTRSPIFFALVAVWFSGDFIAVELRILPIAHHADLFPAPVEIRSHIRAALAADPTGEPLLDIGQSGIIGPRIAADRDRMAAAVVGAIDQQATHAHFAHLAKRSGQGRSRHGAPLFGGAHQIDTPLVTPEEMARSKARNI